MGKALVSILFCFIILSCKKNDSKYPYAINDFSKKLRPYLETIVTKGYTAGYNTSEDYIEENATNEELNKLCYSEHPLLRAAAIVVVLERKKGEHFDFIVSHLDDTATIAVEEGEFGIHFKKVADYMVREANWKTLADREKIIDEIIFKHNDLSSAYSILPRINAKEKYYKYIREMAVRDKWNYENEDALYGLSKFKKKDDVDLIKKELRNKFYFFKSYSFHIMREFQDTAFLNILDEWGRRRFTNNFCSEERYTDNSKDFIYALAVYKNERVADIFSRILDWNPKFYCRGDLNYLKNNIYNAIWDNQCDAYSRFMKIVNPFIKEQEENSIKLDPIPARDNNPEEPKITWWDHDDK